MMHSTPYRRFRQLFSVVILSAFIISACASALPGITGATVVAPAQMTQDVTRVVTQDVTQEVTLIVTIPVTVTPTSTPLFTFTPSYNPTIASGSEPPVVTILGYSDCLYGPASFYLYKTSLQAASQMEVVGRSPDGAWIDVEQVHGWDPCWIPTEKANFNTGSVEAVPVAYPKLPVSYWYKPPAPTAHRDGSVVTITWKAVGMAEYDYRGYLILAWVCQGGAHIFLPVSIVPPYAENTGTLSAKITDEPGCSQPSSAHIYTAEKRGYFGELIFWP
jgi:hypothetical protein